MTEFRIASPPHELILPATISLHPDGRIATAEEAGATCIPVFGADAEGKATQHEHLVALLRIAFRQVLRHRWLPVRPAVMFFGSDQLSSVVGRAVADMLERAAYDAGALSVHFTPLAGAQGSSSVEG